MGQSTAETVREIEQTRDRIEADLRELEDRLPAPATWAKRAVGVVVGGGVAGTVSLMLLKRARNKRKAKKVAQQSVQAVIQVLPEQWSEKLSEALENETWKGYAAAAVGVWLLFRLAELRQLRRMNRALVPVVR